MPRAERSRYEMRRPELNQLLEEENAVEVFPDLVLHFENTFSNVFSGSVHLRPESTHPVVSGDWILERLSH